MPATNDPSNNRGSRGGTGTIGSMERPSVEIASGRLRGALFPGDPGGTGVLVLAGSSGRIDQARARLLSRHGATALALGWFGGPGQTPDIREVPLELFSEALDLLESLAVRRLAIVGLSKGAEAALL